VELKSISCGKDVQLPLKVA